MKYVSYLFTKTDRNVNILFNLTKYSFYWANILFIEQTLSGK